MFKVSLDDLNLLTVVGRDPSDRDRLAQTVPGLSAGVRTLLAETLRTSTCQNGPWRLPSLSVSRRFSE